MKIKDLAFQCLEAIRHPDRSLPDKPLITIVGKHSLFPHGGGPRPRRILCVNSSGETVYHYQAMSVLAALAANELIGVEVKENQLRILWVREKDGSENPLQPESGGPVAAS
jgi:hypothetical protein